MQFSLKCVQYMVTSVLRDQQYMLAVKSLLMIEKVSLMRKNLVAMFQPCNDCSGRFSRAI